MKYGLFLPFLFLPAAMPGQSAWIPAPGHVVVTAGYFNQSFDYLWFKGQRVKAPGAFRQQTVIATVETGINRWLAADISMGFTSNRVDPLTGARMTTAGLTDSVFGLRWKVVDEQKSDSRFLPTISLRTAGIVQGTYEPGLRFSSGDGASGAEFSVLAGKAFGRSRFGSFGDAGYRVRNRNVPPDLFGSAGLYRSIGPVTLTVSYRRSNGLNGMDLFDNGFTYPGLKEIVKVVETGIGFTRGRGRSLNFFTATTVGGRNTGDAFIVGVSGSVQIARR